jgi:hypothetical protein
MSAYQIEIINRESGEIIIVNVLAGDMLSAQDIVTNNNPGWFVYRML